MKNFIQNAWVTKGAIFYLVLIPLSWLFAGITALRRWAYRAGVLKSYALPVPVIIVGNINVGGSGKTPVTIWLVNQLKQHGYKPAVISRGYGGSATQATSVTPASLPSIVGDEPVLIASRSQCPVWVGADRVDAATALLKAHPECNIIISDDGLQHYRLKRDFEIAIADNASLQTACLLPAGPLREAPWRLKTVDAVVCNNEVCNDETTIENAYTMQLVGEQFYNLTDKSLTATVTDFQHKKVTAIAGIGKPERFFAHLRKLGINFTSLSFDDHYAFTAEDMAKIECDAIIMTEKDAVKCKLFAKSHYWVLPVAASMDAAFMPHVLQKLAKFKE